MKRTVFIRSCSTVLRVIALAIPALVGCLLWECAVAGSQRARFLFGSPTQVLESLSQYVASGLAPQDMAITAAEAFGGFVGGNLLGLLLGLSLAYLPRVQRIAKWYIAALGAIPIFALAPMMIMWFGVGYCGFRKFWHLISRNSGTLVWWAECTQCGLSGQG